MANKPAYRRTNYFVKKSFQSRFSFRFALLIVLEALLIAALFLYASRGTLTTGYHGSELHIERTASFFCTAVLMISIIAGIAIWIVGMGVFIVFSHRIAGPVFRLQRVLESIGKGDLTHRIKFRDKDILQDLADDLNGTVGILDERMIKLREGVREASRLAASGKPEDLLKCRENLERLKATLDSFKTSS